MYLTFNDLFDLEFSDESDFDLALVEAGYELAELEEGEA